MLISPAFAQDAAAAGGAGGALFQLLPLVLIFGVFYFLVLRPQQKKMKAHRAMLAALRRGDRIVTSGGLIGTIAKVVDDNELLVDLAENVRVRVSRAAVAEVTAKTDPAKDEGDDKAKA